MKKTGRWFFAVCLMSLFILFGIRAVPVSAYSSGETITGTFPVIEGMDVATVRYLFEQGGESVYGFASFTETGEGYAYSFEAPSDGFEKIEALSTENTAGATVIAEYYSLTRWDGAVDVSWYNETDTEFYIYTPAQFAGVAAIVNGCVDGNTPDYRIKGDTSYIDCTYEEQGILPAHGVGPLRKGLPEHDFSDRAIYLMNDLDMGGTDGSEIDHYGHNDASSQYDYPNWMPIGGSYLADNTDFSSMVMSFFNGTFDGNGHSIDNLYCYRRADGTDPEGINNAFCYSQGVGLFGAIGTLYKDEETPETDPAIRNVSLSGYVYGRRMTGGLVGYAGGGSNSVEYNSVNSILIENCANHAYVYNTDSKGVAGIIATAMVNGNIINCYNTGNISTNYANPCGGIVGSNEGMNVYCCYNTGQLNTNGNSRGRGIGCNADNGANYIVNDCYYLTGTNDDSVYPGYYTANLAPSVSVNVTEISTAMLTNGELLALLNVNGNAYVAGPDGLPVLYWEVNDLSGAEASLVQVEGGTVGASVIGDTENGTVIYLTNEAETGWVFRYYSLNGQKVTGHYVTVNGDAVISAVFEAVQAGVLNIAYNPYCDITVTKNGTVEENGAMVVVENYSVAAGDSLYENDELTVHVSLHDDAYPENEDMIFKASAGFNNPYNYSYTYVGTEASALTTGNTYTVNSHISEEGVTLLLEVIPLETQKLWRYIGDTSWYDENASEFTIRTARELAGVQILVLQGETFAGKTIRLGNDISMVNDDGTSGRRFWDGIGNANNVFSGTFDAQGYRITDLHVNMYGLFAYVSDAAIQNVSIYGDASGNTACGIAAYGKSAQISNCSVYSVIDGDANYSAGILGQDQGGSSISSCFNYGTVTGTGKVGGLVGELSGTGLLSQSVNQGDVSCKKAGNYMTGGLVGSLSGIIEQCANTGNVTSCGRNTGGITGQSINSAAKITDSYNTGSIVYDGGNSTLDSLGGIIGFGSYYDIENTYNFGAVTKQSGSLSANIGAVIGRDSRRSVNTTQNVYYNSDANNYAVMSIGQDGLGNVTYWSGIQAAGEEGFANRESVLTGINGNESFVLTNETYPELQFENEKLHVHTGGMATCIKLAVCETCALSYGELDPDHHTGDTEVVNKLNAAWTQTGYTGDTVCKDCGAVLSEGEEIPVDTSIHVFTVSVVCKGETITAKDYTVAEFDALKSTTPIGYNYGKSVMATDRYVTLESIFEDVEVPLSGFAKAVVRGNGVQWTITKELYENSNKFYLPDGTETIVPAAIAIHWTTGSGELEALLEDAVQTQDLRFGYGITEEEKENAPGNKLISPVDSMVITIEPEHTGVTVSGTVTGYIGEGTVVATLKKEDEIIATASAADNMYSLDSVEDGAYILSISADGDYVTHEYSITVSGEDLTQDVCIYQLGDVNMDTDRSASDVTMIGKHVAKLSMITDEYVLLLADVTRGGGVTAEDVTHLGRFVAKLISQL